MPTPLNNRPVTLARRACAWIVALMITALTGCGVELQVATPVIPTPTPRYFPSGQFPDGTITRLQARPHLTFVDDVTAEGALFMQSAQPDVLLLTSHSLTLPVAYDVTWFAYSQSSAQVRMSVFTRDSLDAAWSLYETQEATLNTTDTPYHVDGALTINLYPDLAPEPVAVLYTRVEVGLVAYLAGGETRDYVSANEFAIYMLPDREDIASDPASLWPPFDEAQVVPLLADWRAWGGGPCGVASWTGDLSEYPQIEAACAAWDAGDVESALLELLAAVENTNSLDLVASVYQIFGLLSLVGGNWEDAAASFQGAYEANLALGYAWEVTLCLHNLAVAHALREDWGAAQSALRRLEDLRSQFYDEPGIYLSLANAAYLNRNLDALYSAYWFFEGNDLPQLAALEQWAAELEGQ
jgi:hypothetical protein